MLRIVMLLAVVIACLAPGACAQDYVLSPRWSAGGTGAGLGKYGIPESVAIDSLGRVVVTDKGRMMLHVYALADGRPLFDVGKIGSARGQFDRPNGIATDGDGHVFVVEQINRRVQIFDRDYQPLGSFGQGGSGPGAFGKPMGIVIDRSGRIFITDAAREDVQVFDHSGNYLWSFSSQPRLASVESIEIDSVQQRILVCDEGHARVNLYDMQGQYTSSFGSQGTGPGQFGDVPNAVRLDTRGRIYINDQGNARINVYRPDTRWLASFRCAGRDMQSADGMALSEPDNVLLVADQGNDRVLAFDLGEMQCRLARDEMEPTAAAVAELMASADSLRLQTGGGPAWRGARIDVEATGTGGDPLRVESAVVHARTGRDPRGLCITLVETGAATNRFWGQFDLLETTSANENALGSAAADTLRLHVAGDADQIVVPIVQLAAPLVAGLRVQPARAGVVTTDFPTIAWQYVDPAGLRRQTAAEVRVRAADGTLLWQSPVWRGGIARCRYAGPPLPRGEWLRAEVRVACGAAWSAWTSTDLRRSSPAAVLSPVGMGTAALLRTPEVRLRALLRFEAESEITQVEFEIVQPGHPLRHVPATLPRDGIVHATGAGLQLHEDEWVRWRVVLLDHAARVTGPWWWVTLDAQPGVPRGPQRPPAIAADGAADTTSAGDAAALSAGLDTRAGASSAVLARGTRLRLASAAAVLPVEVIDVRGRRVRRAHTDAAGSWVWDGRDAAGGELPRGIYFVRVPDARPRCSIKVVWLGG
jgi:sugar lactone lactonase YvrE